MSKQSLLETENALLKAQIDQLIKREKEYAEDTKHQKTQIAALLEANWSQMQVLHNNSIMLCSDTQRISTTNDQSMSLVNGYYASYKEVIELTAMLDLGTPIDLATITTVLRPLLTQWSFAETFLDFLPAEPVKQQVRHARPLPGLMNIKSALSDTNQNTQALSTLVYSQSYSMWKNINSFMFLQKNWKHQNLLKAYLSICSTFCLWQINRPFRASYQTNIPIVLDYDLPESKTIIQECLRDLSVEAEPVQILSTHSNDDHIDISSKRGLDGIQDTRGQSGDGQKKSSYNHWNPRGKQQRQSMNDIK